MHAGGATVTIRGLAPNEDVLTDYDIGHFLIYARLIDAERAGIDWRLAASEILLCRVDQDPGQALACWQSHLARAHWVVDGR